jgi:hypothetical protein
MQNEEWWYVQENGAVEREEKQVLILLYRHCIKIVQNSTNIAVCRPMSDYVLLLGETIISGK